LGGKKGKGYILLYICTPNNGNAAAKIDLAKEFAARAEAA